jgi:hypothetical protein
MSGYTYLFFYLFSNFLVGDDSRNIFGYVFIPISYLLLARKSRLYFYFAYRVELFYILHFTY